MNKVILIGNVGGDPETREFANGGSVTSFSLATTERWKDKDGNKQERTEWHRCKAFGKLGGVINDYVRKGSKLSVIGSIEYGSYEKDGVKQYTTDIKVSDMELLDKRDSDGGGYTPPKTSTAAPATASVEDDDLPF